MRSGEGGPDTDASNVGRSNEAHRIRRHAPLKRKCTTDTNEHGGEYKVHIDARPSRVFVPPFRAPNFLGMQSSPSQTFRPFAGDYVPPRSRTTAGSIWAPKQQETEPAWPPVIDGEGELSPVGADHRFAALRGGRSEDVFGPFGILGAPRKRDVGAIGDGRKRQSPKFDDTVRVFILFWRIYACLMRLAARRAALAGFELEFSRAVCSARCVSCYWRGWCECWRWFPGPVSQLYHVHPSHALGPLACKTPLRAETQLCVRSAFCACYQCTICIVIFSVARPYIPCQDSRLYASFGSQSPYACFCCTDAVRSSF